jgi:hypothetical protein
MRIDLNWVELSYQDIPSSDPVADSLHSDYGFGDARTSIKRTSSSLE